MTTPNRKFLVPPMTMANLEYLRPIAEWYRYMDQEQVNKLPIRVVNALDSLSTMMGKTRSHFDV